MKRTVLLLLGMILMWTLQVNAQWSITAVETDHTIDFETTVSGINEGIFDGSGFATTPATGQLDADGWAVYGMSDGDKDFGVENTTGDLARGASTGGEATGGVYAFEVETGNHALGVQPSGTDFSPGYIGMIIKNNTGDSVNAVSLSYDLWVLNNEARASSFNGEFSLDGITWGPIDEFAFTTTETADGSPAWNKTTMSITDQDMGFTFYSGDSIFLRWDSDDVSGSGSRDEIAVDNITASFSYKECFPIASFPFEEGFEGTYPVDCWDTVYANTSYPLGNTMLHTTDEAYAGSQSYRFSSYNSGSPYEQYLITPELDMSSEKVLEFWYRGYSYGSESFTVGTSTTGNDVTTNFTWEAYTTDASTTWQKYTLPIDATTKYVAIQYNSVFSYYLYVDDFTIREISSETDFLTYSFPEETGPAVIDDVNHEINIEVDFTADLTSLVAEFTLSTGATATVGGTPQVSGVTENDFSSPVTYTVTAEDGITTQDWLVTVTQAGPPVGANCSNPFTVELPAALPYTDAG
ncbi:MAG: choice-of-anchor J domain-containing protein, partial [Bacteroidota bacterium]|nr:choice-of-anchor J domain-containing protein [Bacteroidota bacterium]